MKKILYTALFAVTLFLLQTSSLHAEETAKETATSVTIQEPDIPVDLFALKLGYMTSDELFVEADAWLKLLKERAKEVYDIKIEIKRKKNEVTKLTEQNASKESISKIKDEETQLIDVLNEKRNLRKDKEKKLDTILKEIDERIGLDENGKELDKVLPYRRYLDSVSGMSEEITSAKSFMKSAKQWIFSEEGGLLWLMDLLKFMAILFAAYILSKILSSGVKKAFALTKNPSQLLNEFIVNMVKKVVMFLGLLMGLAVLGVNMGPVLAVVGAAGFVVAFALQNTLSNFASGLMIMLYRPFDIDDVIDVAGVVGSVKSMTLVTTSIMTADNRMMIIPNNTIWGSIITNITHSDKRRVDLTFGIGYSDNIEKAQKVLEDILSKHALILKDPSPTVQVHELGDSSVNFICRPWVLTEDYWTVYWEITRRVKIRFDEEGISIPFPQRDIHVITSMEGSEGGQKRTFTKEHEEEIDMSKMESGEDDV